MPHNPFANVDRPLNVGRDWSHVDLSENYVAIMEVRSGESHSEHWYVAVRGGRTTGHWSQREAEIVGKRLEDEISGRCCGVLMVGTWMAWANPVRSRPEPVTVAEYFGMVLDGDEADRTAEQYKTDPLVAGTGLEV